MTQKVPLKNPWLAVVLSLVWCGIGQIYNGELGKGILLAVLYGISFLLMAIVIGYISMPVLLVYGIVDAYQTATRINSSIGA